MRIIVGLFAILFSTSAFAKIVCDDTVWKSTATSEADYAVRPIKENADGGPKCMFENFGSEDLRVPCSVVDINGEKVDCQVPTNKDGYVVSIDPRTMKLALDCSNPSAPVANITTKSTDGKSSYKSLVKVFTSASKVTEVDLYRFDKTTPKLRVKYRFDSKGKYAGKSDCNENGECEDINRSKGTIDTFSRWSGYDAAGFAKCCAEKEGSLSDRCAALIPVPVKAAPAAGAADKGTTAVQ